MNKGMGMRMWRMKLLQSWQRLADRQTDSCVVGADIVVICCWFFKSTFMSTDLCTTSICLQSDGAVARYKDKGGGRGRYLCIAHILLLRKQTTTEMKCQLLDNICQ